MTIAPRIGLAIACISIAPAYATEIARFNVDLDNDGSLENISLVTEHVRSESGRSPFTLKVGSATFKGEYFSAEGDFPQISFVRLDYASGQVQLQVMDIGPSSCTYTLLAYKKARLHPLLTHEDKCQEGPSPNGGGQVSTRTWMGFWSRFETYQLDKDGTALVRSETTTYPVNQYATTTVDFVGAHATCPVSKFHSGMKVSVKSFDSVTNRYLIESTDGRCGWVEDRAMADFFEGLPWAG